MGGGSGIMRLWNHTPGINMLLIVFYIIMGSSRDIGT